MSQTNLTTLEKAGIKNPVMPTEANIQKFENDLANALKALNNPGVSIEAKLKGAKNKSDNLKNQ